MDYVKRCMKRSSLAVMLLVAASYSAAVLAIDCQAATSKIDKAICADSELSRQDAKLNQYYGEVMGKLSPEGQSALRSDQRAWLRYRATACGFADDDKQPGDLRCLQRLVYRRVDRVLALVAGQQEPSLYRFSVRSSYETTPDPSGGFPFWSESSIPQIDRNGLSTSIDWSDAQAWNVLIAKLIGGPEKSSLCAGGKGDVYREPHIHAASSLLITVTEERDDTCRNAGPNLMIFTGKGPFNVPKDHFMSETQYSIVMMRGDVHELQPADLFSTGDDWRRLLTERVQQALQRRTRNPDENSDPSADAIRGIATDPSNWMPGRDFSIRLNLSDLYPDETTGEFTVTIPWSDLQGVLSFKGKRILTAPNL